MCSHRQDTSSPRRSTGLALHDVPVCFGRSLETPGTVRRILVVCSIHPSLNVRGTDVVACASAIVTARIRFTGFFPSDHRLEELDVIVAGRQKKRRSLRKEMPAAAGLS